MTSSEAKAKRQAEVRESGLTGKEWYRLVYLRSDHWKDLRLRAMAALEKVCCQQCGATRSLDVHHLRYRSIYDVKVTDLQVLCRACHEKEHEEKPNNRKPRKPRKERKQRKPRKRREPKILPEISYSGACMGNGKRAKKIAAIDRLPVESPLNPEKWIELYSRVAPPGSKTSVRNWAIKRFIKRLSMSHVLRYYIPQIQELKISHHKKKHP